LSGHSKWATTKYRKSAQDKARGKLFAKLIRQIEVAAREGGGDLNSNANLRTAYGKARDASVPLETIERAIKRGTGELEGVKYEHVSYEGYGPNGVAIIVECLTDNRNRTGSEIRYIFSRNGGSLAEPNAVSWQFERKGLIKFESDLSEDDILSLVLDSGAENFESDGESYVITTSASDLAQVKEALEASGKVNIKSADIEMLPTQHVLVDNVETAKKILKLLDALEEQDDVQSVFDNADIDEQVIQSALSS
jgi:YebC/PmpR family DNA-binding regulatory protein